MAKVRVYELAKEFGVESKAVMAKLQEMGEFVRSASSTIEAPVVRRLKEEFAGQAAKAANGDGRARRRAARRGCQWHQRPGRCARRGDRASRPRRAGQRTIEQLTSPGSPSRASGRVRPSGAVPAGPGVGPQVPRPSPGPRRQPPGRVPRNQAPPDRVRRSRAPRRVPPGRGRLPLDRALPRRRRPVSATAPRPGPRPGNNPFSSTATGMGAAPRAPQPGTPAAPVCARQSRQCARRPASGWPASGRPSGPRRPG